MPADAQNSTEVNETFRNNITEKSELLLCVWNFITVRLITRELLDASSVKAKEPCTRSANLVQNSAKLKWLAEA